jgi:uncharacterized protein (DUF1330 family)
MPASGRKNTVPVVMLMGLQVTDEGTYARYRAAMTPLLEAHGGRFGVDVRVAEILRAPPGAAFNRLFTICFTSARQRDAFFTAPDYLAIRAELFQPSVSAVVQLGDYVVES